ncbi:unnamed protein product [Cylindrotheca closterium]|uniref:Uncharacterized protein n=1 Tax=Cylindrotheca closterium TaxID=2856 RepID=A0AAD2CKE9_9STRA|nr:unnamed protein product [Cylindrotheca closterium]
MLMDLDFAVSAEGKEDDDPFLAPNLTVLSSPSGFLCFCGKQVLNSYFARHLANSCPVAKSKGVTRDDVKFKYDAKPKLMRAFICVPCGRLYLKRDSFSKHFKRNNSTKCRHERVNFERECMAYHTLHYIGPTPGASQLESGISGGGIYVDRVVQESAVDGLVQDQLPDDAILLCLGTNHAALKNELVDKMKSPSCLVEILLPLLVSTIGSKSPATFVQAGIERVREGPDSPMAFISGADKWMRQYSARMVAMLPGSVRHEMLSFRVDTEYESIFTVRNKIEPVCSELKKIIHFTWKAFGLIHGFVDEQAPLQVPKYLYMLKSLKGAYAIGSTLATILYICCLGSLGEAFKCNGNNYIGRQLALCKEVQQGRVIQTLSPLIRQVREYEKQRKNGRSGDNVSQNGDVVVSGSRYPKALWSQLIPKIRDRFQTLFCEILGANGNTLVSALLDPSVSLKTSFGSQWYHFEVGVQLNSTHFQFKRDYRVMEKIHCFVQLVFHGVGFGAMRHSEIKEMEDCAMPRFFNEQTGYSPMSGIKPTQVAQDIFGLDHEPTMLDLRHVWTDITGFIFGSTMSRGELDVIARQTGHSSTTHQSHYAIERPLDEMFRIFHKSLGEKSQKLLGLFLEMKDVERAMKCVYGKGAMFLDGQEEFLRLVVANPGKNVHATIPCGCGKSASYFLMAKAAELLGVNDGVSCVVVPYAFLLDHMLEVSHKLGVQARVVRSPSICRGMVPDEIKESLPSILLFTVDSFANMMEKSGSFVGQWVEDGYRYYLF